MEYKGNILWNTLAKGLKCISSIGSFQNKLKRNVRIDKSLYPVSHKPHADAMMTRYHAECITHQSWVSTALLLVQLLLTDI